MSEQVTLSAADQAAWRKAIVRAWNDAEFKERLIGDPNATLAEAGLEVPSGVNLVVVENEPSRVHLVIPAKPGANLNDSELEATLSEYNPAI